MAMKNYLRDHKDQLAKIVDQAIRQTFKVYFKLEVDIGSINSVDAMRDDVVCRTNIHDGGTRGVIFLAIERHMLIDLAKDIYPPDMASKPEAYEACATEIANIVCSRIKTYLNEQGYDFDMDIPLVSQEKEKFPHDVEVVFSVKEDNLVVDIGMEYSEKEFL